MWNCCGRVNADRIEKLQRRGTHNHPESCDLTAAMKRLAISDTLERRSTKEEYNRNILSRRTRKSNHLRLPSIKLECTKKAFHYHGCIV